MKLNIKSVTIQNFRSIGSQPIVLNLDQHDTTLITGDENGAGKSSIFHAIIYCLFNKAYSDKGTLPKLVNTKNNKKCRVEVSFKTKGNEWKVVRGQKPAVFEIYKDDKLVEAEAATRDYQSYLNEVIGVDFKTFCNTVILGRDRFKPFVGMNTGERRFIIEQILDLIIFADMNEHSKSDLKENKKQLEQADYELSILLNSIKNKQDVLDLLKQKKQDRQGEYDDELNRLVEENKRATELASKAKDKIRSYDDIVGEYELANDSVNELIQIKRRVDSKISELNSQIVNLTSMSTCPTCEQEVEDEHKEQIKKDRSKKIDKAEKIKSKAQNDINDFDNIIVEGEKAEETVDELSTTITKLDAIVSTTETTILSLQKKQADTEDFDEKIKEVENTIKAWTDNKSIIDKQLTELHDQQSIISQALIILKDDGLKAEIIRKYIPFLNTKINEYLDAMNFWLGLNVDETFNISITTPNRSKLSIADLSTGQASRVNLAFLLAFRDISKMKASIDCNLLVLDETLENLSESGVGDFMDMVRNSLEDTNLWVISQRSTEFAEYFQHRINFKLVDDFTVMT
ncbi:MAG: AAA family ATPase [Candidatus Peribacteraceae bacterium]|nr:AAA family ATPase [Candidatus Peribacteraceae bacterium]